MGREEGRWHTHASGTALTLQPNHLSSCSCSLVVLSAAS